MLILLRLKDLLAVVFKHALAYWLGPILCRLSWFKKSLPDGSLPGPERFRMLLEDLGGAFIKFGQMLALQPDVLSLESCNALFNLMDRVTSFEYRFVEQIFLEELGRKPSDIFEYFDQYPIAAASIGQVHVGYLKGQKVAVKVQRPGVEKDFSGDIRLMSMVIAVVRHLRLRRLYWVIEPMSEFIRWTQEELDYRREARYMDRLRKNACDIREERVPAVWWEYTTRRTLVAEFLDGTTVLDYLRAIKARDGTLAQRLKDSGFAEDEVARHIIDNFLRDAFRYGIFHADLHPANLVILPQNVVGYVDFGITGLLSYYSRHYLAALTLAYTRADLDGMCAAFFKVSTITPESDLSGFRQGLKRLEPEWYDIRGRDRRLRKNFTLMMLDMLVLSRRTGIWPERDVIKYIRSAIAIDGLITRFAPKFNVGQYLEEGCSRYLKAEMTRMLISYESFLQSLIAGGDLVRNGAFRAATIIKMLASGEVPTRGEDRSSGTLGELSLRFVATMISICGLAILLGDRYPSIAQIWSMEYGLTIALTVMLFQTLRRLA